MRKLNKLQRDNDLDMLIWDQNHGDDPTGERFARHLLNIELEQFGLDTPQGIRLAKTAIALGHRPDDREIELLQQLGHLVETLDDIQLRAGIFERHTPRRYVALVESARGRRTWVATYGSNREHAAYQFQSAHGEEALVCEPFRETFS